MKCPNCNKDMEKGFLSCWAWAILPKYVRWYREYSVTKGIKDEIQLGDNLESFICKKCKTVITKYK